MSYMATCQPLCSWDLSQCPPFYNRSFARTALVRIVALVEISCFQIPVVGQAHQGRGFLHASGGRFRPGAHLEDMSSPLHLSWVRSALAECRASP